jgi:serine/threonine protein kinase
MIGKTLGPYRIDAEAGAGGMGVVYRGTDVVLKRTVAIKVLNAGAIGDAERRRRFIQEAQAASALNHPDIVTIYQVGSEGATDFIAMEFVAGRSLEETLRSRPLPLADAIRVAIRIAGALGAAHRAGIVHRDLKPANVMLTEAGGVKLLDFGVAKLTEIASPDAGTTLAHAHTQTGMVMGTPAYMSPEQARGEKVDARSDIYAFGLLLREMMKGRPCGDVHRIVARCVEPDLERRFQNIDDVRIALEDAALDPPASAAPARANRAILAAAAAVTLLALAAAGWATWRARATAPPARAAVLTRLTMDSGLTIDPAV